MISGSKTKQNKAAGDVLSADVLRRLREFRRDVEAALPDEVVEMRLFGSRARGDAHDDSDYDVAVFVRNPSQKMDRISVLADAAYDHHLEGVYISPVELPADYLDRPFGERTELADEIIRDGVVLP